MYAFTLDRIAPAAFDPPQPAKINPSARTAPSVQARHRARPGARALSPIRSRH
jgi:hypothetical protein